MMKKNRRILLSTLFCILPIIYGLYFYEKLPDLVPVHFDFNGNVNGYTGKNYFIFGLPIFLAAMNVLSYNIAKFDPKNKNGNIKMINLLIFILPIVSNVVSIAIILNALGIGFKKIFANLFLGIFFIIIGNYLPKFSQNYTIGIRTPWSMHNEENWYKTHRFASKVYMIIGILFVLSSFINNDNIRFYVTMLLFSSFILPFAYSYILYRKNK